MKKLRKDETYQLGYNYRFDSFSKSQSNKYFVMSKYLDGRVRNDNVLAYKLHYYE